MLKLSLKSQKVPVQLEGENGVIEEFELREMNAAARDRYLTQMGDRVRFDKQGNPQGIKNFDGMQASLLVQCMKRKDGTPVNMDEIQKWPASIVSDLFREAQKLNHLNQEDEKEGGEEAIKNG